MENNSKQAVLSIVGIAILVIAVVGVSFAFFTYSKQGTTNNVITTGKIEFAYEEVNNLSLTNQFPSTDEEGLADNSADAFQFNVSGTIPATANPINYTVTAVAGDTMDPKVRMQDSEINVYVTGTNGAVIDGGYDTNAAGEVGAAAGNSATGFQIAHGTIEATGTEQQHDYTLTMWVNDSVTISDTDEATYCASEAECQFDDREIYSNLYYSLKVNVEANDTI